jgi:hypothetical protein
MSKRGGDDSFNREDEEKDHECAFEPLHCSSQGVEVKCIHCNKTTVLSLANKQQETSSSSSSSSSSKAKTHDHAFAVISSTPQGIVSKCIHCAEKNEIHIK